MSNKLSRKFEAGAVAMTTGLTLALGGCATGGTEAKPAPANTSQAGGANETAKTPDFTPGASGKYSPGELQKASEQERVERLRTTGDTPQEAAESATQAIEAFLMSGTTMEDAQPYLNEGGQFTDEQAERFAQEIDEKYARDAGEAWAEDGTINDDLRVLHRIILKSWATNVNNRATGLNVNDYQVGHCKILSAKSTGDLKGRSTLVYIEKCNSNYADSIMGIMGKQDPSYYGSAQKWDGVKEITQSYVWTDGHLMASGPGETKIL